MQPSSAEYTVTRTYLDWLVELPWSIATEDKLDIQEARDILDEDHYGLEKVKKRILEYLAVRKLKSDKKGPILCLVGPPGVGKTSLGRSIARALGRKFVRISLGGVRDEAEIRGHRRTYVGALPGRIIQGMKKAGTNNPVFMLDEIDKLGHDFRGDPAAALLEVLDPEQNNTLLATTTSRCRSTCRKVMFVATANILDPIPPALARPPRDPRAPRLHARGEAATSRGSSSSRSSSRSTASRTSSSRSPTRRSTRSSTATRARPACATSSARSARASSAASRCKVAEGEGQPSTTIDGRARSPEFLGPQKFMSEVAERTAEPGVATGLAWTPVGGDILFIEATQMPGKGKLVLTGQLGDVMKESAQAALSFVRAQAPSGSASRRTSSRRPTSTSTSRPARSRRTARRRASRCSPRWCRCSPACRSATTSR